MMRPSKRVANRHHNEEIFVLELINLPLHFLFLSLHLLLLMRAY